MSNEHQQAQQPSVAVVQQQQQQQAQQVQQQQAQQQAQQQVQQSARSHGYQRMFKRLLQTRSLQQKPLIPERIVASYKVYGWLIQHDPAYESTAFRREVLVAIDEIFDIVLAILEMMKCSSNLLVPIIIYADKFVNRSGIKHNQLFNLLLTSTVVTLKFWSESTQVNNAIIAEIFNFSLKDMNLMERRFLIGVDYNLCLTSETVTMYLLQLYENQQIFLSSFKHPFDNPPQLVRKPFELIQFQHHQQLLLQERLYQQQSQSQQSSPQASPSSSQESSPQQSVFYTTTNQPSPAVYTAVQQYASQQIYMPNQMVSPMC
ncbi:hypothetical protein DFA_11067 [Cavenderia fasciculata]|uniref:Cyclin N-terminal domain-containing protein n=1 Tax=Cavenderia fasciculata TaxID=261658 RepID=F4QEP5_CACFS|nr:uncharacterized protein DFA_11067 [Cavenderia fasciculata]EGG13306.1 hypothetical protein DFA_11067 [Cavenderia fasciculata]|eukprot:XP_004350005.1 hypothetical protein DFA_11067 [Cavenderia fasciculata]